MIRVHTLPRWRTELVLANARIPQVLEQVAGIVTLCEHDLPLLLEQQRERIKVTVSRIPRLDSATPDSHWFSRSCDLLKNALSSFQPEISGGQNSEHPNNLSAVIGLDAGSAGHHCHSVKELLQAVQEKPEQSRHRFLLKTSKPVTICVLNNRGIYIERGLEFNLERNRERFSALLNLAMRLEQDQISVEDGPAGTISTFNLRSGVSGLSLPRLKLLQ